MYDSFSEGGVYVGRMVAAVGAAIAIAVLLQFV